MFLPAVVGYPSYYFSVFFLSLFLCSEKSSFLEQHFSGMSGTQEDSHSCQLLQTDVLFRLAKINDLPTMTTTNHEVYNSRNYVFD